MKESSEEQKVAMGSDREQREAERRRELESRQKSRGEQGRAGESRAERMRADESRAERRVQVKVEESACALRSILEREAKIRAIECDRTTLRERESVFLNI